MGIFFSVNIICFGTKHDANSEIMSLAKFYFIYLSIHQDPKNNWRVPFNIQKFVRFSLISLSIHPRSRRGAERIDQQQQQQQQSVASAILATTQQKVRKTRLLP